MKIVGKEKVKKLFSLERIRDILNRTKEGSAVTASMEKRRIYKPIFIVGCGRSGTTLLFGLLKKHPQLIGTTGYPDGEDHVGWIEHGNCVISGLGSLASINGGHTGFHYCLHMNEHDVTPDIVRKMTAYYNLTVIRQEVEKRVVNKCPHLSNKLRYVRGIFPDAKFVQIIRDCLPVVSSWIKMMEENQPHQVLYWPETEFPCFWVLPAPPGGARETIFEKEDRIFPGDGVVRLVDYWSTVNTNIPIQLSDSPGQLLTIRYEDLCDSPLRTLARVCDFCEIDRFFDVPLPVYSDLNEKYKSHLVSKQIDAFLERSRATRVLWGYA